MSTLGRAPANSVVSAEDIADNSINASKVIDGSIDVADLSSSVVTTTGTQTLTNKTIGSGVTFPAGHVIQIIYATKDTGFLNNTTTYADTGSAISITPKKSTSKIVVQFQADVWYSGGGDYFDLQIRATGGMTNANIMTSHDTGTHIGGGYIATAFHQVLTPVVSTTSSITFTMWVKPNSSSRSMYYPNDASNSTGLNKVNMLAWEIAQ